MAFRRNDPSKVQDSALKVSNDRFFETVKKRAYELYCKRGYTHGCDRKDWFEAEHQVKRELGLSR